MKKMTQPTFVLRPLAFAISLMCVSTGHAADSLIELNLVPGAESAEGYAISADGSTIVGSISFPNVTTHPFVWRNGVMTDIQENGQTLDGEAVSVSADGSVIAGKIIGGNGFRYEGGTFTSLQPFGTDAFSRAYAISGDGSVIAGQTCANSCLNGSTDFRAAAWHGNSGIATLLPALGVGNSSASAVNQDGTVIVGYTTFVTGDQATYWFGGTAYDLGTVASAPSSDPIAEGTGRAFAVSADGKMVAGSSDVFGGIGIKVQHATLWNASTPTSPTAIDLGALESNNNASAALGISANGKVVVGTSSFSANPVTQLNAFRWTQATGMQSVTQWLANAGVTVPAGWELSEATSTNKDGSVVIGTGPNANNSGDRIWLARVANPVSPSDVNTGNNAGNATGSGLIDIADYNVSVAEAGARAVQAGVGMPNLTMFGAHHRSILDSGLARSANGVCAWATADASGDNRSDTHSEITEAGICKDIGTARIGLGVGQAWSQQDLSLNGSARYNGQYLILEAANAFDNGLQPSVTAYYGRFDTSMDRHYMNGAAVDSSSAKPKAQSYAVRARLDWKDAARLGKFDLSPYAAYTWMRTQLDAYTETGGGFPAQFDASSWSTNDLRIGSAARTTLSASTDLRLGLEAVHRVDGNTNGVTGQILGLWSFSVPGQSTNQTWARGTIDIDNRISDSTLLTVGLNLASPGGDATWGVTAGIKASF